MLSKDFADFLVKFAIVKLKMTFSAHYGKILGYSQAEPRP
jgi:hypothetical protein